MRDLTFFGYPGTKFFFGYPGTKFIFGYPGTNFFSAIRERNFFSAIRVFGSVTCHPAVLSSKNSLPDFFRFLQFSRKKKLILIMYAEIKKIFDFRSKMTPPISFFFCNQDR